jgi:hypothetical protein
MCMCVRGYKTKFNKVVRVFHKLLYCVLLSLESLRPNFPNPKQNCDYKVLDA